MKEYMKNLKVDSNPTHDDVEALCSVFAECMGDAWGDGTHVLRRLENAPVASGHVKMVFFHDSEKPKHRRSAKDAHHDTHFEHDTLRSSARWRRSINYHMTCVFTTTFKFG